MAGLMTGYLGSRLRVVSEFSLTEIRTALRNANVALMMLIDDSSDPFLTALLEGFRLEVQSERPWEEVRGATLVTGRDLSSLSWVVAKSIASQYKDQDDHEFQLLNCAVDTASDRTHIFAARTSANQELQSEYIVIGRENQTDQLQSILLQNTKAISYDTHGMDSCAKGGAGVVLCGLHSGNSISNSENGGVLACGLGHDCPRGPQPMPLRSLPTQVLMLGSCNSLRLENSSLARDFNLGLSFLDGVGLSYVGTVLSVVGHAACSQCFLAALAALYSVSEATALVNGLLCLANLDYPAFIAVGTPDVRLQEPSSVQPPLLVGGNLAAPFEINFGKLCFGQFLTNDPGLVELANKRQLLFEIKETGSDKNENERGPFYFYRVERQSGAHDCVLRVFVFRFPRPLNLLRFEQVERSVVERKLHSASALLQYWIELWRLCGTAVTEAESFAQITEFQQELLSNSGRLLTRLPYDSAAGRQLNNSIAIAEEICATARDLLLTTLAPRLSGPFWLANEIGPTYQYEDSSSAQCPICSSKAISKRFRHTLLPQTRVMIVCPRCLTVADLHDEGDLSEFMIHAPDVVSPGQTIDVRISLRLSDSGPCSSLLVIPRLSTYGMKEIDFEPPQKRLTDLAAGADVKLEFALTIPQELIPHQYFFKALAGTDRQLAFASRMIFVTQNSPVG